MDPTADSTAAAGGQPAAGNEGQGQAPAAQPSNLVDTVAAKPAAPAAGQPDPAAPAAWQATALPPEFLGGKYKTLGDVEKGIKEQQRLFTETQGKLKAFTGAPEKYELTVPKEFEGEMTWKADDPMLADFQALCKEGGISQEFFGKAMSMLAKYEMANSMPDWAAEKALIGDRADERITAVTQFYEANLDEEGAAIVKRALGVNPSPGEVMLAMERLIQGKRQPALPKAGDDVASAPTVEEINRKYRTVDPNTKKALIDTEEGRTRYRAELSQVVGSGEHRVVVGRQ